MRLEARGEGRVDPTSFRIWGRGVSEPETETSGNYSAFDGIAPSYDSIFTQTSVMRAQRWIVWKIVRKTFQPGSRILEINCGTGEDAVFMARSGLSVLACDASRGMIEVAQRRKSVEGGDLPINFLAVPTEHIRRVAEPGSFDGIFSNFSGLNFVRDLRQVANDMAALTRPRARMLLCVASRICLSETLWFAAQFQMKRAARRFSGFSVEPVGDAQIEVWYRTVQDIRRQFSPFFRLYDVRAVGLCVPPYYFEPWARRHPMGMRLAATVDRVFQRVPLLRALGDHVLLCFEKRS
jgi:ubiquinone/menaquinone biosynthesis C-methylase UbiE